MVGYGLADSVAAEVYEHPSMPTLFGCKAPNDLSDGTYYDKPDVLGVGLSRILEEIIGVGPGHEDEEQLASNLRGHLKDKRFLILIITRDSKKYFSIWKPLLDALIHAADGCRPASAIILTTWHDEVALSSSPYKIINARNLIQFYGNCHALKFLISGCD